MRAPMIAAWLPILLACQKPPTTNDAAPATSASATSASAPTCAACKGECVDGMCKRAKLDDAVTQLVCTDAGVVAEINSSTTSRTRFFRVPASGTSGALVLDAGTVVGLGTMEPFAMSGSDIYFFGTAGGPEGAIYHGTVGGGAPTILVDKLVRPRRLVVTKDYLAFQNGDWTAPDASKPPRYGTSVSAVPRAGGPVKELFRAFVGGIASDAQYAYVGAVDQGLIRVDPRTGERKSLSDRRASVVRIADGDVVFQSLDKIAKVPTAGGGVVDVMASAKGSAASTFDARNLVYVQAATTHTDQAAREMKISFDGKLIEQRADGQTFELQTKMPELDAKIALCNGEVFFVWGGSDTVWSTPLR